MYNENGLRVQKTVNNVVTKYTLHGKNVVHMKCGNDELHFFYDAQNKPAVVVFNGTPYSYVKNLQGDIVAILNSAGTAVVNYVYDAWGRPISKTGSMAGTLGTVQPFRYRGYVYDEETGLYYLRSRYYHASLCRFISNDSLIKGNLYTYCGNKPVCNEDANGFAFISCREANGDDTNFMPSIMCGGDGYLIAGIARLPRKKSIQQRVADKGVTFNPSNDEYGGEIVNSYKLNPLEMIVYTEFLKDEYGDIYEGTAVGFYFEWAVHDFAYAFFSLVGNEKKVEQSKNLDFGATIYDDKHDAFSLFMFTTYQVLFPFHSLIDRYVLITQ